MSFTDGKPWIATAMDVRANWSGLSNGDGFRCNLCGHRFQPGDRVRWQYSNIHINLLVCEECDDTPERLSEKFLDLLAEYNADRFWWFRDKRLR